MKNKILWAAAWLACTLPATAQLTVPPEGDNKKAMVAEQVGLTQVTIEYSRPGIKGREGKIWGQLVHTGYADLNFGTSKAAPWRAGANENTTIEFSTPVNIEGKALPAGKYGLFIAYDPENSTVIFSKNSSSWGSFFYDPQEDALKVTVKPVPITQSVERLQFEFRDQTPTGATVALLWEKLMIPFRIETDYIKLQLASFRKELRGERSFNPGWQSFVQAAQFCLQQKINLDEGLQWADHAINGQFIGEKNFVTLSTKAQLLKALDRPAAADSLMKEAMPLGNAQQIHGYARQLLQQKRSKEAFEFFKFNYDKNPILYTTNIGMMRGYSALGNFKQALVFAKKSLALAPDKNNRDFLEQAIKQLEAGKDVN